MNWFERFLNGVTIGLMMGIAIFVMLLAYQIAMEAVRLVLGL
jgi:hypothetical protein